MANMQIYEVLVTTVSFAFRLRNDVTHTVIHNSKQANRAVQERP